MRVLAVGGGAREHAIVAALVRSGAEVYACLKNKNPGICRASKEWLLVEETDVAKVAEFGRTKGVDLAIVGPEAPLEAGLADGLRREAIPTASPSKAAARIETSKSFMRELMAKHNIKGALKFKIAETMDDIEDGLAELGTEVVVKPTGLTGGKGVKVFGEHLISKADVHAYADEILSKRIGGTAKIVLEEKLVGEEFTIQAFCDGKHAVPMLAVQDHKRAYEGDKGPNTGGMGSYSQKGGLLPFLTRKECDDAVEIMDQVLVALKKEEAEYRGTLYGQFMLTKGGPRVIEFNARFGDPEAMNVLSLLKSDFVKICDRMANGSLSSRHVGFLDKSSVCKYVVPEGYGTTPLAGQEIKVDEVAIAKDGAVLYYASVNEKDGKVYTTTSRSVGIVGIADSIDDAEKIAENAIGHISGRVFVRHDIGRKAMLDAKVKRMKDIRSKRA